MHICSAAQRGLRSNSAFIDLQLDSLPAEQLSNQISSRPFQGGCASVIVSLTTQCPQDLTPYSGSVVLLLCFEDALRSLREKCVSSFSTFSDGQKVIIPEQ